MRSSLRRRLAAPLLCEALEPRALFSVTLDWAAHSDISLGGTPTDMVFLDTNNDQIMDVVYTDPSVNKVFLRLGTYTQSGYSFAPTATGFDVGNNPIAIAAGDFNGDSFLDLLVVNAADDTVSMLTFNQSTRLFNTPETYNVGMIDSSTLDHPVSITVGDFNGDFYDDFAVACSGAGGSMDFWLNAGGNAGFGQFNVRGSSFTTTSAPVLVTSGDFNGDLKEDIAYASADGVVTVRFGAGNNTFSAPATYQTAAGINSLELQDINGDNSPDLVATYQNGTDATGGIVVMLNNTHGVFGDLSVGGTGINVTVAGDPTFATAYDFNHDGKTDLAISCARSGDVKILLGDDANHFTLSSTQTVTPTNGAPSSVLPLKVFLVDYNYDGKVDLMTLNNANGALSTLINNTKYTTEQKITAGNPYSFVDANGDTVTITLSGPGTARAFIFNGDEAYIEHMVLEGTTIKSSLSITVTNKADRTSPKTTTVGKIELVATTEGTGVLSKLSAASVNFDGNLVIDGGDSESLTGGIMGYSTSYINSIAIRDLGPRSKISLDGSAPKAKTSLSARVIADMTYISIKQRISTATFVETGMAYFMGSGVDTLKVTGDKKAGLTGDFGALVFMSPGQGFTGYTLGSVTIAGAIKLPDEALKSDPEDISALWTITGKINSIKAKSLGTQAKIVCTGHINTITITGNLDGQLAVPSLGTLTVGGSATGAKITLDNVGDPLKTAASSIKITGDAKSVTFTANGGITSLYAASFDTASKITANGAIGTLKTKTSFDGQSSAYSFGTITVGGNLTGGRFTVPTSTTTAKNVINNLKITGDATGLILNTVGNVGTVSARSISGPSSLTVKGDWNTLKTTADFSGTLAVDRVLTTWTVGGNLSNTNATLAKDSVGTKTKMLGTLSVKYNISTVNINGLGSIGSIKAQTITDSKIYAGATAATIDALSKFLSQQYIQSITITGAAAGNSVSNSIFAAYTLQSVSLKFPDSAHKPALIAHDITKMTVTNKVGSKNVATTDRNLTPETGDPRTGANDDNVTATLLSPP